MILIMLAALCVQVVTVAMLRWRLGRGWLRRPVTLLVLAAVVYHGVSAALLKVPSIAIWDRDQLGIEPEFIDLAMLVMSIGIFVLVICYLAISPKASPQQGDEELAELDARLLDWRVLGLACLPLAVLTYHGRGYNSSIPLSPATPLSTNLASTFLVPLLVLAAFGFLLKHGMRWFLPVLVVQSVVLAAAGQRTAPIIDVVVLLLLLTYVGMRPTRKQMWITLSVTLILILGITGYRAVSGRELYYNNSGLTARIAALGDGLYALTHASNENGSQPGLVTQAAIRFDGNSFAGGVLQAMHYGQPPLGSEGVGDSMLIAVPSALWSAKLADSSAWNPVETQMKAYGLQDINFLPTFAGMYIGFLGQIGTIVFLGICGAVFSFGERLLFRRVTVARLVLAAGAIHAALNYEQGLPSMLVSLRTATALAIVIKLIEVATRPKVGLDQTQKGNPHYASARTGLEQT